MNDAYTTHAPAQAKRAIPRKTGEVAAMLGVSRQALCEWVREGKIPVAKAANGRYVWDDAACCQARQYAERRNDPDYLEVASSSERFDLGNRRYLGAKTRLLPFIEDVVRRHTVDVHSMADIFAGTGVVADMFRKRGMRVTVNDILASNTVVYECFFGSQHVRSRVISDWLSEIERLRPVSGYVTDNYGGRYFSVANAERIDAARDYIERLKYRNRREKAILLTSLLYGMDKVANTVGHYDAYRKHMDMIHPIRFAMPDWQGKDKLPPTTIHSMDANVLVRRLPPQDLVYIDTPYNSRQYGDAYHVLENIVTWHKPELYGVAKKALDRSATKSEYCTAHAAQAFADLITHIRARYILVSYNNMAQKGNGRSNAKISNDEIIEALSARGKVQVYSTAFQAFTTGKTHLDDHRELLYLVHTES